MTSFRPVVSAGGFGFGSSAPVGVELQAAKNGTTTVRATSNRRRDDIENAPVKGMPIDMTTTPERPALHGKQSHMMGSKLVHVDKKLAHKPQ